MYTLVLYTAHLMCVCVCVCVRVCADATAGEMDHLRVFGATKEVQLQILTQLQKHQRPRHMTIVIAAGAVSAEAQCVVMSHDSLLLHHSTLVNTVTAT